MCPFRARTSSSGATATTRTFAAKTPDHVAWDTELRGTWAALRRRALGCGRSLRIDAAARKLLACLELTDGSTARQGMARQGGDGKRSVRLPLVRRVENKVRYEELVPTGGLSNCSGFQMARFPAPGAAAACAVRLRDSQPQETCATRKLAHGCDGARIGVAADRHGYALGRAQEGRRREDL